MDFRSLLRHAKPSTHRDWYLALSAPALAFLAARAIISLYTIATSDGIPNRPRVLPAPSVRILTAEEYDEVPYPPDALPGGRNVSTPHGNLRVYEWGPEHGRRVLFVHGISTPCIALSRVAGKLVKKGCRVMLFDLPGRGYSDCPDTSYYHQDTALFSACILSAVSCSPLPWTTDGFTLVGYSLGGGIAAAFTAHYPELVESLVLVAPGGLLRPTRLSLSSKILYSGLVPDRVVNYFVGRRLRVSTPPPKRAIPPVPPKRPRFQDLQSFDWTQVPHSTKRRISVTAAVHAETVSFDDDDELRDDDDDEAVDPHAPGQDSLSPIFENRPDISPATAVAWQLQVHPGFVPAFISCIKHAPIHDGHADWRLIGQRCRHARARDVELDEALHDGSESGDGSWRKYSTTDSPSSSSSSSLSSSMTSYSTTRAHNRRRSRTAPDERKVLMLLGKKDVIITPDETIHDASEALGKENIEIITCNGGHDLVLSNVDGCVHAMTAFWERGGRGV